MAHLHGHVVLALITYCALFLNLHIFPDCDASQITCGGSALRPDPTFPITAESDLPLDKAMISLSSQLEPHDGQVFPTPIGFGPKKAWLPLESQYVQVTQILLFITLYRTLEVMYFTIQISLFFRIIAEQIRKTINH